MKRQVLTPGSLTLVFCTAQIFAQLGAFTFAALLPDFIDDWALSHTQAGWLSGIFFGAYAVAVPVLVTLTDRVAARHVYSASVALTTLAHLGMALIAEGFVVGMLFRFLAGVGWAGTYMVGLRALSDELSGRSQIRAVGWHAGSLGVGGSLSFLLAGLARPDFGWQGAFLVAAGGSVVALLMALTLFPRHDRPSQRGRLRDLLDLRPVLSNRPAMGYALAYAAHTWEMFVLRSWCVAFLAFSITLHPNTQPGPLSPTVVAMLMGILGTVTTVAGNELALRIGRERWIVVVMGCSTLCAFALGPAAGWSYTAAIVLCLVYNAFIFADSAALTAGVITYADPERRGATMAVYSMAGYGGGFLGPLSAGIILDALGPHSVVAWSFGFAHVGALMLFGIGAIVWVARWNKRKSVA